MPGPNDKQAQLLKGNLDVLLLKILESQSAHGYAVIRALEERSEGAFALAEGTVYPALYRLEKQGLLRSERSAVGGRQRRVYEITAAGKAFLQEEVPRSLTFFRSMQAILQGSG